MQLNNQEKLYLGLDIGTNSVGWAITNQDYNLLNFKKRTLWGVRVYSEAQKATDRRLHRSNRRRKQRQKQRQYWLKEIFKEEIQKIDKNFFKRLEESNLWYEDKTVKSKYLLFNEKNLNDKFFLKNNPTIHHLKKELIESTEKKDLRIIYLALNHYMKNRGHFLNQNKIDSVEDINIKELFININKELERLEINESFKTDKIEKIKTIIKDKNYTNETNRQKALQEVLGDGKVLKELIKAITGSKANFKKLLNEDKYDFNAIGLDKSFSFKEVRYEEELEEKLKINLNDDFLIIVYAKQLYNWSELYKTCNGEKYVSYEKVNRYEKHKEDLEILKDFIKENYSKETYRLIFNDFTKKIDNDNKFLKKYLNNNFSEEIVNFVSTTQKNKLNNYAVYISNADKKSDFYSFVKKVIEPQKETEGYNYIIDEIEKDNFLPRQRIKENALIPHQLYKNEIEKILNNASKHYKFLNEKSEGFTNKEKIIKTFEFKIPYYVGPLNNQHKAKNGGFSWVERDTSVKITPWNFDNVINKAQTAENFITNMTSFCTYLKDEKVIPKCSLLYSNYEVLNEINNLKINNEQLSIDLKEKIINNLFKKYKTVSLTALKRYLVKEGVFENIKQINFSGIDNDVKSFKSSLKAYIDFKNILQEKIQNYNVQQAVEDVILWATLFTDKNILKDKIKENYSNLFNSEEIIKMTSFKYTGWGRFSKKFLTSIKTNENYVNKQTGQTKLSIIDLLKYTNFNLMEIINNSDLGIKQQLDNFAMKQIKENITYKDIEELYCSPSVKKQIWQTVLIAKELKKTLKTSPNKVFIEMARAEGTKNRTLSRRKRLEAIYNEALKMHSEYKKELTETKEQLQNIKDDKFKIKKLYHYFMQMGKCVYTNNPIDLDDLMNDKYNKMYNIDHIYPQSKIKDDSITNTVLVDQTANARKADVYPINLEIQNKCKNGIWLTLKKCGLFSNEKYARLIRKTKLTAEEKMKFVERQLVETRQTTKEVAKLLKSIFPNSKIVYSKSENIGLFKQNFAPPTKKSIELGKINKNKVWDYGLVKCREVNDLHHAKDAYLNIVVGNVYDTKFSKYFYTNKTNSKDYKNYNAFGTREERLEHFSKLKYHIKNMYDYNVEGAWVKDDNQTISSVIRNINKNNILFTKESQFKKGELWAQNASKKEKNLIPIKKQLSNTLKYGGYKSVKASHFAVIEYENNKGVKETKFETVPIYLTNKVKKDNQVLIDYFKNKLQAKNVKVIMDKIKIGSVIELDGAPFIVTGNNDNVVLGCVASQLIFPKELVAYIKKLVKFKSKVEYVKKLKKQISITDSDEISKSENLELYNLFIEKLNKKQYANIIRPLLKENLIKLKDKFINLPIEEQAVCLINILPAFQANASSANLKLLGKGDNVAKVQPGKKSMYEDYKSIKVIDYSITGLFKKERKIK